MEKIHTEAPSLLGCDNVSLGVIPHTLRPMVTSSSRSSTLCFCWVAWPQGWAHYNPSNYSPNESIRSQHWHENFK